MSSLTRIGGARVDVPEASGLAWDPRRRVLLAVGDDSGCAYEIELSDPPAVTRVIALSEGAAHDLEGLAITDDGRLLVASEKKRSILVYDRDGRLLDEVAVAIEGEKKNAGLEGLAIDASSGRVFVVHERAPRRLLELDASFAVVGDTALDLLDDLSGLCASDGVLWLVSDDSRAVVRLAEGADGWVVDGTWDLGRSSAEGIEVVGDRLYVVFDADEGDNLVWYRLPG